METAIKESKMTIDLTSRSLATFGPYIYQKGSATAAEIHSQYSAATQENNPLLPAPDKVRYTKY